MSEMSSQKPYPVGTSVSRLSNFGISFLRNPTMEDIPLGFTSLYPSYIFRCVTALQDLRSHLG